MQTYRQTPKLCFGTLFWVFPEPKAQAHKAIFIKEQNELIEKFQNKKFQQKRGKDVIEGGLVRFAKARLDAHIHKHHFDRIGLYLS